jgi:molybdenum cofactor cytidylyltransferase
MPGVRVLLLCGGRASRFGSDKLLAPVKVRGDSLPMAAAAARAAIEGAGDVLAVIPPGAKTLRDALEKVGCGLVESAATADGMGASLAAGVEASRDADGWIVALGDMPFIEPSTFASILSSLRSGALIAAPCHGGANTRGHPVGFSAILREELAALAGDEGARSVLHRHRGELVLVPVDDRGIAIDIDVPGDLDATSA